MKRVAMLLVGLVSLFAVATPSAHATILDLTTAGSSGFLDGAFFQQVSPSATGSGVIDPFVRVGSNTGIEQGYNTDGRPTPFDENSSPTFTHSLLLSSIPVVTIGGVDYRQFLLDINQTGVAPLLSLDSIQLWLAASPSIKTTNLASFGTPLYNLDSPASDNWIKMNYSLNTGSGSGDMFAYIPDSAFPGAGDQYVYFYSHFGGQGGAYANNDGFEEWATLKGITPTCVQTRTCTPPPPPPVVPEPTSMLLMGSGLLACLGFGWSRKRV